MNTDLFANGLNFNLILDMLRRRRWIATFIFSLVLTAVISLVFFLPSVYQASAIIVVEGQQIPREYINPPSVMTIEHRLQTISQEILGRTRLAYLATKFGLYEDLKQKGASDDVIASIMRQDISIEIKGRSGSDTVAFSVSYTNSDPQKAMEVANTLASYYIEENFKIREEFVREATQFLRSELDRVKEQLEEQERQVRGYKEQYLMELPSQLNANMSALSVLEKKMEMLSAALSQARERRNLLTRMAQRDAEERTKKTGEKENLEEVPLSVLIDRLAIMRSRFSDKHPDVIRLTGLIETLKKRPQQIPAGGTLSQEGIAPSDEGVVIDGEIQRLAAELKKVQEEITIYQKRVESAPQRELEMQALTRDYETTHALYESLLKRLQEASLADSMEQRQKAERFRVVEHAVVPSQPAAPKRMMLLVMGLMLGIGGAVGGALLREVFDPSFYHVDALRSFSKFPVLVSIPQLISDTDRLRSRRRQYLVTVALAVSVIAIVGVSYWLAAENEPLVRSFVRSNGGIQFR